MDKQIHHIAITAQDMQETLDFYVKLGFTLVKHESLETSDRLLLKLGDVMIEAFCPKRKVPPPRLGLTHIAIAVDDIEAEYRTLVKKGITFQTPPQSHRPGIVAAYFKDPNGIQLHLQPKD